jgi:anti-sigma factor RsiW
MTLTERDEMLVNAYLDGELGPSEALSFERRLEAEPQLLEALEVRRALSHGLRTGLAEDLPSADLERRVMAGVQPPSPMRSRAWQSMAATFLIGALIGGGLGYGVWTRQDSETMADQLVSAHIRALMAPQPADVASTDRHTVKPWFAGKLAFSPKVVDLAPQGFPLVGGRIDVIGLEPIASLVYTNGKHLISLMQMAKGGAQTAPVATHVEHGYLAVSWSEGEITYWAISDMAQAELDSFIAKFRATQP